MKDENDSSTQGIALQGGQVTRISEGDVNPITLMFDSVVSGRAWKMAGALAASGPMVPRHLRNNPGACFAIVMQAVRWRMDPFTVASQSYNAGSENDPKIDYMAQLVHAVALNSSQIEGRFHYEKIGDWRKVEKPPVMRKSEKTGKYFATPGYRSEDEVGVGVRVKAKIRGEEQVEPVDVMLSNCHPRNSTLYATNPFQQLCYIGVRTFCRRYLPEVLMGVYAEDERVHDDSSVVMTVAPTVEQTRPAPRDVLRAAVSKRIEEVEAEPVPKPEPEEGPALDARGVPWIEDIHSSGKSQNADGSWKRRRGTDPVKASEMEMEALRSKQPQPAKDFDTETGELFEDSTETPPWEPVPEESKPAAKAQEESAYDRLREICLNAETLPEQKLCFQRITEARDDLTDQQKNELLDMIGLGE